MFSVIGTWFSGQLYRIEALPSGWNVLNMLSSASWQMKAGLTAILLSEDHWRCSGDQDLNCSSQYLLQELTSSNIDYTIIARVLLTFLGMYLGLVYISCWKAYRMHFVTLIAPNQSQDFNQKIVLLV